MSFADWLPRRAPKPARKGRYLGQRLDLVYFALAAFDILTISAALLLNHVASTAFEKSVRLSQDVSVHLDSLLGLQHAAQLADAPGNDVFISHDVAQERQRLAEGLADFDTWWQTIMAAETSEPSSAENRRMVQVLQRTRPLMDTMMRDTTSILDQMDRGDVVQAGRHMASLDQTYARLNAEIEAAISHASQVQLQGFEDQVKLAREARQLEWAIAGAILLSVTFVVFYGLGIGRTMRRTDEQRIKALADLEAAHLRLARYADNVSHELRGPVSKMRVNTEVLLGQDRSEAEYKDVLASNLEDCQRLSNIIDGLLFLARAENTQAADTLPVRTIKVGDELALIREFFEAAAEKAGVDIRVENSDAAADVDRALFQRAVINIVSNALSNTPAGGRIVLRSRATPEATQVEIEDSGVGIAPDQLDMVFDRFHSTSDEPKADGAGLGLGLPITKAIVDLHGGGIALDSVIGRGTRVTLSFPRRSRASVPEPQKVTAA
ncbi:MAG: ATP-binding protein [Terricaulis sp.]